MVVEAMEEEATEEEEPTDAMTTTHKRKRLAANGFQSHYWEEDVDRQDLFQHTVNEQDVLLT